MSAFDYGDAPVPVRGDIGAAHDRAWRRIARPGTWHSGEVRVRIAAETRNAKSCRLCAARKDALSPYAVEGEHDCLGGLPDATVEAIHRIATDPGRLTRKWYEGLLGDGLTPEEYVETVGVVCTTISIDTFARAMGLDPLPLPEPVAGEPIRLRPASAGQGAAWVPWIAPGDAAEDELDLFSPKHANIHRSMSLVPAEARGFFDLVETQYLQRHQMRDFANEFRAITHAQIELIAGRISAINQCVY